MPDPRVEDLERAAARHWQAPDTERLGGWLLRAADGFTGRANSALPLGNPGVPLPEAVTAVGDWYRRRGLRPMIVLPKGAGPDPLESFLTERSWVPRPGPAFVMTADVADLPASRALFSCAPPGRSRGGSFPRRSSLAPGVGSGGETESSRRRAPSAHESVEFTPEPDAAFLGLYRYRGQELPPIARTLMMSAPWQAFGSIRRDGRAVAVGRVSVAGDPVSGYWGALTAVEVDPACQRQGLGLAITAALVAAAADRGASRLLLQVETGNAPARALYHRCGFRDSHRYHYMLAPA